MVILWGKIMVNNRMTMDTTLSIDEFFVNDIEKYLKNICYALDIETPIILNKHKRHLQCYNMVKFTKDDFVDYINFDSLIIEKGEKE